MTMDPSNHHKNTSTSRRRSRKDALRDFLSHFQSKDQVLITIDPDPDAIGSALAVKRLLWHRVQSTTIGIIRPIRRLNNQTLARLLKLPLVQLKQCELSKYDRCIVVDGQPHHNDFFRQFSYTAVIDHHPLNSPVEAPFVDIRPHYGATSTIFSEYLKAAGIKPSQTLATAMLYGIKTDTRNFERHTIVEDIEAFRSLFNSANHNVLRKVEISDLSIKELKFFHKAVERKHVVRDRVFVHLDEVTSADILVEIAEFFLKIHDISWSIVSGIFEDSLIIVIRNDGYRKDAGKLVRKAFGGIGCAGGHTAMARAEIPMEKLIQVVGKRSSTAIERYIRKRMSHTE
ncbi:MAG: DHH family phosphoesterase [Syntrophobacteraceae bacterium]|jgi:nanoRNase/pAp phosphatase (c-di-AMP/oligoRNAs hydrolase)|nr:DHH family phosphoesterase [Syntrophobacteraceae bacterium]